MKRQLFIFFILFSLFKGLGQTNVYHPFPDSNAVWNEMHWSQVGPPYSAVTFPNIVFLAGDTIISTLHYKKILSNGYEYDYCCGPPTTCCYYYNTYMGAIRQDSIHKKVYICKASTTVDTLLYDFNLSVGDTLPTTYINFSHSNYVSTIDSILIGTSYRKQYHISTLTSGCCGDSNYVSLIEGIGSTLGLAYQIIPAFESGSSLYCFRQDNVTLYPNTTDSCSFTLGIEVLNTLQAALQIYPNPNNGSFVIEPIPSLTLPQGKGTLMQVYDVNGKLVLSQTINGKTNIDASSLNEGVYNISIISNEGVINKRIVIIR